MDSSQCTIVHFSYGGHYSKDGVKSIWIPSEDKVYAIVIKKSFEEVTYYDLLSSIYEKVRKDEASTSLIMSYITLHLEPPMTSYISNDEEVFAYFMTLSYKKRWSILNVEVVEDLSQGHGDALRVNHGVNKAVVASKFMEWAEAYTEAEFIKLYDAFRMRYPTAAAYLDRSVGERKWSRCFFPGERYNILTTNTVKSINGIFRNARKYSLLPMIDIIIEKIGEWFNKHRKSSVEISDGQKMVLYVEKILHARCKDAVLLTVHERNSYMLEYSVIGLDGYTYLVDLRRKTCSCKCFDVNKFPCVYALAANYNNKMGEIDVRELCSRYYWVEMWALAYHQTIYPVPDKKDWVVPPEVQEKTTLSPVYVKKKVEFNKRGSHQLENIVEEVRDVGLVVEEGDQVKQREKQVKVGSDRVKVVEACSVGFVVAFN